MKKFVLLFTTAAGICILIWAFSIVLQSRQALNWPQTKGAMVSASLTIDHLPKFMDRSVDPLRWYGTEIEYKYRVDGQVYYSNRFSFIKWDTRSSKPALNFINYYRHHPEVVVYYNPDNPFDSVIKPGDISDLFIPLMLGGLFAFLGLISYYGQSVGYNARLEKFLHQGHVYQNQGKIGEALWEYTQAIKINPSFALGYNSRGGLYLQQESWDQAIEDFTMAIKIAPHEGLYYFALANAYSGKKEYAKAWGLMQRSVELGIKVRPEILETIKKNL